MRSANDIAEWIVRYSASDLGAPVDPMSLEKLAYYAQAFHLALHDRPLFREDIEAWRWGPVVPSVYKRYQTYGSDPIVLPDDAPPGALGNGEGDFLSQIIGFFCQHTAVNLSRATHLEDPWLNASKSDDNVIEEGTLRDYYRSLMDDGERALSRQEMLDTISEPRWSSYYVAGIAQRMMSAHPFYEAALAKKLAEPTPLREKLPSSFFAPVKGRDFIKFGDDEPIEETIRRVVSNN